MRVERALQACGGVARARQLHTYGVGRHHILRALADDRIVKLRNGIYASPTAGEIADAAHHGGSVTCASALRRYGVWTLDENDKLHIIIPSGAREYAHPGCACIAHHSGERHPFGVVPLREALRQAATCLAADAFFAALESALNMKKISRADRAWLRRKLPVRLHWLVDFARPDAQSGIESILRLRLHMLGLRLESQVLIPHVGRVDFVVDHVIIEVDGRLGHADPASRHKDLVRDAEAARQGYQVLRFDYAQVIYGWPAVAAAVLAAAARQ